MQAVILIFVVLDWQTMIQCFCRAQIILDWQAIIRCCCAQVVLDYSFYILSLLRKICKKATVNTVIVKRS